jgi:hypothetical protein
MSGLSLLASLRSHHNMVRFGFVTTNPTNSIRSIAKQAGADFLISNLSSLKLFKRQFHQAI